MCIGIGERYRGVPVGDFVPLLSSTRLRGSRDRTGTPTEVCRDPGANASTRHIAIRTWLRKPLKLRCKPLALRWQRTRTRQMPARATPGGMMKKFALALLALATALAITPAAKAFPIVTGSITVFGLSTTNGSTEV